MPKKLHKLVKQQGISNKLNLPADNLKMMLKTKNKKQLKKLSKSTQKTLLPNDLFLKIEIYLSIQ